jgi:predicted RNA-binding Zn-ribbon protein involved in translation (DUF1610 family)
MNMSDFFSNTCLRRLNLGGGGGGNKTEYLLVAGLAAIIIGAIALTFWGPGAGDEAATLKNIPYRCEDCGHEWKASWEDVNTTDQTSGEEEPPPPGMSGVPAVLDCPSCGAHAGYRLMQCINCQEWFIPHTSRPEVMQGGEDPGPIKCTECGAPQ